jgi:hypothetical protein
MAEQQTPLYNGFMHAWSQVEIVVNGRRYQGVKSLNYTVTIVKTKVRGTAQVPIGRTTGQMDVTGDIEVYMSTWDAIAADLGDDFGNAIFDIDVSYRATPEANLISDELVACAIGEIASGGADGNDGLTRKVKLDIMNVKENGRWVIAPPDNTGAAG